MPPFLMRMERNFTHHARFTAHEESELYLWHKKEANCLEFCYKRVTWTIRSPKLMWKKFGRNKSNLGEQQSYNYLFQAKYFGRFSKIPKRPNGATGKHPGPHLPGRKLPTCVMDKKSQIQPPSGAQQYATNTCWKGLPIISISSSIALLY